MQASNIFTLKTSPTLFPCFFPPSFSSPNCLITVSSSTYTEYNVKETLNVVDPKNRKDLQCNSCLDVQSVACLFCHLSFKRSLPSYIRAPPSSPPPPRILSLTMSSHYFDWSDIGRRCSTAKQYIDSYDTIHNDICAEAECAAGLPHIRAGLLSECVRHSEDDSDDAFSSVDAVSDESPVSAPLPAPPLTPVPPPPLSIPCCGGAIAGVEAVQMPKTGSSRRSNKQEGSTANSLMKPKPATVGRENRHPQQQRCPRGLDHRTRVPHETAEGFAAAAAPTTHDASVELLLVSLRRLDAVRAQRAAVGARTAQASMRLARRHRRHSETGGPFLCPSAPALHTGGDSGERETMEVGGTDAHNAVSLAERTMQRRHDTLVRQLRALDRVNDELRKRYIDLQKAKRQAVTRRDARLRRPPPAVPRTQEQQQPQDDDQRLAGGEYSIVVDGGVCDADIRSLSPIRNRSCISRSTTATKSADASGSQLSKLRDCGLVMDDEAAEAQRDRIPPSVQLW